MSFNNEHLSAITFACNSFSVQLLDLSNLTNIQEGKNIIILVKVRAKSSLGYRPLYENKERYFEAL